MFGEKSNIDVLNWNFEELKRFFFFSKRMLFLSFPFPLGLMSHCTLSPDKGTGYLLGDIFG